MTRVRWFVGVAALLLTTAGAAVPLAHRDTHTAAVRPTDLHLEAYASVERVPRDGVAQVRARVAGVVVAVLVHEGDTVARGQVLARVEAAGALAEVQKREAERNEARSHVQALGRGRAGITRVLSARALALQHELEAAEATYQSQERLHAEGRIGEGAVAQARLAAEALRSRHDALLADSNVTLGGRTYDLQAASERLTAAEAALAQAQSALQLGEVTASIAGTVLSRRINPGDVIATANVGGLPIFELADCTHTVLRGELDEIDAQRVQVGQRVNVYALGGSTPIAMGTVKHQSARLEQRALGYTDPRESLVRLIWIDVAWPKDGAGTDGPLGERFEARIQLPTKRVHTAIPRNALAIRDGVATVEVVWGPFSKTVPVELGLTDREFVEIHGLEAGTRVWSAD